MRGYMRANTWARLLLLVLLTLPVAAIFFWPFGASLGLFWFWLLGISLILLLLATIGPPAEEPPGAEPTAAKHETPEDAVPASVERVLDVEAAATDPSGLRIYRGQLREPGMDAYSDLKQSLPDGVIPLMQQDREGRTTIALLPQQAAAERRVRPWLHWTLFALTFLTTTLAGAAHQSVNLLREPERFAVGLPYSLGLLAILGCHELGHYFTARHHRMNVTPPYFIPVPFALGTFGAFIQMKSPPENRRALFDVAVAGPLAGLVVAVPALFFGLRNSEILTGAPVLEGLSGLAGRSSILVSLLAQASLGEAIGAGNTLRLSPLAFAGWLGLLITALNLLPIGQLDGGHMARAMFGTRAGTVISSIAMMSLFLLALFVWPGLMMWAIIVFFIAGRGTPPLNDVSTLTPARQLVGAAAFGILVIILVPMPEGLPELGSLRCPYL